MGFAEHLPADVLETIRTSFVAEYATVSGAGLPIDTPTFVFPNDDVTTLDIATGLAYPAKAERARRNPKVGLLFEGGPGRPVVSVAGLAAVRDADLQANAERYLAETIVGPPVSPDVIDWSITRQAVWYLTRMIVSITPVHIRWWNTPEAMDATPGEWRAGGDVAVTSDPAPPGTVSPSPAWPQPHWRELARNVLEKGGPAHLGGPGHLTLLDADGFPLPIRANDIAHSNDGFSMIVPGGAPWSEGAATLSFGGLQVFVGMATVKDGVTQLVVERALPMLPLVDDPVQVLQPAADTRATLMERLTQETARRGQPIPTIPATPPAPSAGARYRIEAMARMMGASSQ